MQNTLRFVSIVYIILLSVGLFAHVEIIPTLLAVTKRDAWLSIILPLIFLPVWIVAIYKMVSVLNKRSIIQLLTDHGNTFIYYILLAPLAVYLLINSFVTAKQIIFWSQLSYMQGFSSFTLALVLLIFCLICSESGLFSIGILSSILGPIVLVFGFFISFANLKKKHFELLFPMFSDGYLPVTKGVPLTSLPILELFIIFFLLPVIKKGVSRKQLFMVALFIIGLMLGPTIGAIVEFGPDQAAKYRFPAYEEWRLISIGRYFSHADFFAIYQWLAGGVIRISLFVLIASQILSKGIKSAKIVRLIYSILFVGCIYPIDQSPFTSFIEGFFRPLSFILLIIQLSIIMFYTWKNQHKWNQAGLKYD